MTTERRLDNIDSRLDRIATAVEDLLSGIAQASEDMRINTQRQAEAVEGLTAGIAQISEDVRINRLDLSEIKATTQRQAEVAQRQAETVDRLARIVETLIARDGG